MQVQPYIFFNGQARDAIAFYTESLGAEVVQMMSMRDGPPGFDIPEERKDWVMHCALQLGDFKIMLSDDFMANAQPMAGCNVMLNVPTAAEGKAIFDALSEGGEVRMPYEATFWSAGFGAFSDKFGVRWMVGCDEEPAS